MTEATATEYDWDPSADSVVRDQVAAYDALRERCPVAHSEAQGWSLLRHADVLDALFDPVTFSSRVSQHVAVPNGMDGAQHAAYRAVVNRAFVPDRVEAFATQQRDIAHRLVTALLDGRRPVEVMTALGEPYAALSQCAYLGWPESLADALRTWSADSHRATRARDRTQLDRVAAEFDRLIVTELDRVRSLPPGSPRTLTSEMLEESIDGRPLTDGELVSIMRNWTAGEIGTIAAAVGIIVEFLARRPDVRRRLEDEPQLRQSAMDEMLRLEPPLIANRRRTTREVEVSGRVIPADARVTIPYPGAQRDPEAFPDPTTFRFDRNPGDNLLYGRGPHYCPGEGLSRLELEKMLVELLAMPPLRLAREPVRASYPAGGFAEVWIDWAD